MHGSSSVELASLSLRTVPTDMSRELVEPCVSGAGGVMAWRHGVKIVVI